MGPEYGSDVGEIGQLRTADPDHHVGRPAYLLGSWSTFRAALFGQATEIHQEVTSSWRRSECLCGEKGDRRSRLL
jgi:hypothetical protein